MPSATDPLLLTVLYWVFVGTVLLTGFAVWRIVRWSRVDKRRPERI